MNTKDFKRWCSRVQVGTKDECWEWTGERNERGYGRMKIDGKNKKAHRLAYEHFTGRPLGQLLCCHTCDNPGCVNPNCLWAGTHKDNSQDMIRKGRNNPGPHRPLFGPPKHLLRKARDRPLDAHAVDLIRRFPSGYGRGSFLARWFGVARHTICDVRKGRYKVT